MMVIRKLNIIQIISIYQKSLRHEFPANERRPLMMILRGVYKGKYECLGVFKGKKIIGYAFFVKNENDYLWDYLAVLEEYRNKGVGSIIIKKVVRYYKNAHSVIGEVEDPYYSKDNNDKSIRERRLDFYMRNGCRDTLVRTKTFGVRFILIQIAGVNLLPAEVSRIYKSHYRKTLPKLLYKNNIKTGKYIKRP